jgi:hypothetical protein
MSDDLKAREEQKRDRAYDPVKRWQHIQETITWAEANLPPEKRRNRPRVSRGEIGESIHRKPPP